MTQFRTVKLALCAVMLVISACSPKVSSHGHIRDTDVRERLVAGTATREDVLAELGSPSARSSFGGEAWYYVSAQRETVAFMRPETVEQQVLRIVFNESGVVSEIKQYNQDDAADFALVERATPTEGHSMTIVEQFLGNIGRFNSPPGGTGGINGPGGRGGY